MPAQTSLDTIQAFLAHKRLAMVGVSRDSKDFSIMLFREFLGRGYDVIPVNPKAQTVLEKPCFARLQNIQPPVKAALLMTSKDISEAVAKDCLEAGVKQVWIYGPGTGRTDSEKAAAFCREHGIEVIAGECPFMFFPENRFHKLHGWIRKISGSFPKPQAA